jgi:hypothetical protein
MYASLHCAVSRAGGEAALSATHRALSARIAEPRTKLSAHNPAQPARQFVGWLLQNQLCSRGEPAYWPARPEVTSPHSGMTPHKPCGPRNRLPSNRRRLESGGDKPLSSRHPTCANVLALQLSKSVVSNPSLQSDSQVVHTRHPNGGASIRLGRGALSCTRLPLLALSCGLRATVGCSSLDLPTST